MLFSSANLQRPDKTRAKKDEQYDLDMAKSIISSVNVGLHNYFIQKSMVNWSFYKGDQWIFGDDLEAFLMDESGGFRNRIRFVHNIIRPLVEYYRGNAIRMDFTAACRSISKAAINRRETSLNNMMFLTKKAQTVPEPFSSALKKNFSIGNNEAETERMHGNLYVDKYEVTMTEFIRKVAEDNDFDGLKVLLSPYVALDGIGILRETEWAGKQAWEIQDPWFFFYDMGAKNPDLSDGEFMGSWNDELPVELFERHLNLSSTERKLIEDYSRSQYGYANNFGLHSSFGSVFKGSRVPTYKVYWKDGQYEDYAFVKDKFDYIIFTKINSKDSPYTDKDIVKPPDNYLMKVRSSKAWSESKMKARIFVDNLRYCEFIPSEYVGTTKKGYDIVLESGVYPYSEVNGYGDGNVQFPYKVFTWFYDRGEILAPVDALIDPQRFINRLYSVAESQVNNSRGSGTVFDSSMIDAQGGEDEIANNMNMNKPVFVKARGQLNNSIGNYDNTVKEGTFNLFKIASAMDGVSKNMIGGGEAIYGGGGAIRATGSVNEMNINQGTLMQESVFYCINKVLLQAYQSIASRGRRIYIDNEVELIINVGDEGAQLLKLSKEYEMEDFRVYVTRVKSREEQANEANANLLALYNMQLLDAQAFSRMFNNSSNDDIARELRAYQKKLVEANLAQQEEMKGMQRAEQLRNTALVGLNNVQNDENFARQMQMKGFDRDTQLLKEMMKQRGMERMATSGKRML